MQFDIVGTALALHGGQLVISGPLSINEYMEQRSAGGNPPKQTNAKAKVSIFTLRGPDGATEGEWNLPGIWTSLASRAGQIAMRGPDGNFAVVDASGKIARQWTFPAEAGDDREFIQDGKPICGSYGERTPASNMLGCLDPDNGKVIAEKRMRTGTFRAAGAWIAISEYKQPRRLWPALADALDMGDLPEAFDRRLVWDIDSQTAPKRAAIRESAFQLAFGPVGFRIIAGRKIAGGGSIRFSPALSHRLQGQAVTERRGASSEFRAGPCKMGPAWSAPSPPKSCVCGLSKCFRPSASTPTTADGYLQIRCAFPFWVRDTKARTNAQPRLDVSSQPFYGWYSDARGTLPVHGLPARAEQAEGRERPHLPIAAPARRKTVGLLQVAGTIPEFREE